MINAYFYIQSCSIILCHESWTCVRVQ